MDGKASVLPQYFAGCSAAIGAIAFGTVIGWSSPMEFPVKNGQLGFPVSNTQFAWISSLTTLGAASAYIPMRIVIKFIGRKWTIFSLMFPFLLGWLLIIFAQNVIMLYAARFLLGMCGGAFCVVVPLYTEEIAQTKIRGILGNLFQAFITLGVAYGYLVGSSTKKLIAHMSFAIIPILMGCLVLFIPESPAYYVRKDKMEEAKKSLQKLRGAQFDISDDLKQLVASDKFARENKVDLRKAFANKVNQKALFLSISLMLFQQLSGINAIVFYATSMLQSADIHTFTPRRATVIMGGVMMLTAFLSIFMVDRAFRKILLIISGSFMSACSCGISYYFHLKDTNPDFAKDVAWMPMTCACVYVAMYSFGFGAIPWLVMHEIFSEDIKVLCCSIATTTNWAMAFAVTFLYPMLGDAFGIKWIFCFFAMVSTYAVFFVVYYLSETDNKPFLEIQPMVREPL